MNFCELPWDGIIKVGHIGEGFQEDYRKKEACNCMNYPIIYKVPSIDPIKYLRAKFHTNTDRLSVSCAGTV